MIQILATVHHCVHFTLQVVPFLCSNFPIVRAKQMTSWKWQGMRKSKHISFNCSVQTKSLNNNDISCQIIIYLYNEKNPGYCISSLLLRVIISLTSLLSGTIFLYLKLWVFSSQGIRYWGTEALKIVTSGFVQEPLRSEWTLDVMGYSSLLFLPT